MITNKKTKQNYFMILVFKNNKLCKYYYYVWLFHNKNYCYNIKREN